MKFILPFCFTLILLACSKKQLTFTLQGQVYDLSFNGNLAGADIAVYEVGMNGSSSEFPIATSKTDGSGAYSLTFDRHSATKYLIRITKDKYFENESEISFDDLSTEIATVKNYFMYAMSWVKLSFKNVAPSDAADQLRFTKQEGKENCQDCCPDTERFVNGTKDSVFYCVNNGNTTYSYLYFSVNPSANGILKVTTIPFDTVEIVNNW